MKKNSLQLETLTDRAKNWKIKNRRAIEQIGSAKQIDEVTNQAHAEVFRSINCLECANCCKTTGPLFTDRDIKRLAKHFRMSTNSFIENYLRCDEDGDLVLKNVPCIFLDVDNSCKVYDIRPKACRAYPHTDMRNQHKIFDLTLKNAEICPAVFEILQRLAKIESS